jgi:O-antigen ligase/polysaccharide polymerase Wzy-like membrane protein
MTSLRQWGAPRQQFGQQYGQPLPEPQQEQLGQWADEAPRSRLSEAEMGETLWSTRQGRRLVTSMLFGGLLFVAAWVKSPHLLSVGFVPMATLIACYLYRFHPTLYISFNWWVWILTPFARRFIEIKSGYMTTSPILLAPYMVTVPCLVTLFLHAPKLMRRHLFPFALCLASLCYAYIVGIVSTGIAAASYGLLVWFIPLLLGFHLAMQWDIYPAVRAVIRKTIVITVLFMGVYGVYQFVRPMPWDLFWIYAAHMTVLGNPQPMQFRVFSTLNSPAPFAVIMMASLLVVVSQRSKLAWLAMAAGATSLLLTTVRTAWLAWAFGFLIFSFYVPFRQISRIVFPMLSLAVVVGVVTAFTPLSDVIMKRFESFGTLNNDFSLHERANLYAAITDRVLNTPMGEGMGGTGPAATMSQGAALQNMDSGLLDIVFSLGWFGGLVYTIGLIGLVGFAINIREVRSDYFDLSLRAAALATLSILPSFNPLVGVDGIVFWGFLGLCIARHFWLVNYEEEEENRMRVMALALAAQGPGAA